MQKCLEVVCELNSVFVLMLSTSILGSVVPQHYTPLMRAEQGDTKAKLSA